MLTSYQLCSELIEGNAMSEIVYKICSDEEWKAAVRDKVFKGSALDISDGFIHLSTAEQAAETARLHFANKSGLVLVAIDPTGLPVRYETSRDGQLFPHLYADLPVDHAIWVEALSLNADGTPEVAPILKQHL